MKTIKTFSAIFILLFILLYAGSTYSQVTLSEVSLSGRTHYDLQSNGSSFMIEQSPTNPDFIHAVFTVSTDPAPGWDNRNGRYFITTNGGATWDYIGTVSQGRAGFPVIGITNNNCAVVGMNSTDGGGSGFKLFVDQIPGVGSWTVLVPPLLYIGGNLAVDQSSNKVFFTASGYVNVCTNINTPGTFSGYTQIPGSESNSSSIGIGTGRTGVAYISGTQQGSVKLVETTDGGVTWGTPVNIWVPNFITGDSMGALRGIDITYTGSTPNVVFEVCKQTTEGSFFPKAKSKIMFWSPAVNGGNAFAIDSAQGLSGSNSVNDVFTSVCRPVIGKMNGGSHLLTAYCKARQDTDAVGNNYFDIYMVCLASGGAQHGSPYQVTNLPGQFFNMHDCRYVSISDNNAGNNINILFQADTIPASNVNGAASSWAKMMYAKYYGSGLSCTPNGISNTGTEIPSSYILKQNYPNPFNPVTQIAFDIPQRAFVTLTIYNALGKEVARLVNENLNIGTYKADWDASSFPSGVYFYELKAEGFSETKKMVVLK